MNVICIIAARMASQRFPGKVLELIEGKPMLWHVYWRASRIAGVDKVVVATSFSEADRQIVNWCQTQGISITRGGNSNENDVLSRYWDVATGLKADVVMRITGDCPCIDPDISSQVLQLYVEKCVEYASNRGEKPYPNGYDTEVFSYGLLSAAYWSAQDAADREHVTPWMIRHAKPKAELDYLGPYADLNLSVDTEEDMGRIRGFYAGIGRGPSAEGFGLKDAIEWHESQISTYYLENKDAGEEYEVLPLKDVKVNRPVKKVRN
ncbi:MAG: NTP transferase domain-containing protein [Dehalococcoidia bacterium]|nr:NTP transferase domain-containing protein [Dehalococcoidia bacterium]